MILQELKLENIRSYLSETIRFTKGTQLLSGDVGSGKSTLLQAIEFCIFGASNRLPASSLLRHGATQGSIQLTFTLHDVPITIFRAVKKDKTGVVQLPGWILREGVREDKTPQELKATILSLLNYPPQLITKSKSLLFRYTVYTPQETMKHIILDDPQARLDTLRKLFDVDKYKLIQDNVSTYTKALLEKKKECEGKMHGLEEKRNLYSQKQQMMTALHESRAVAQQNVAMKQQEYDSVLARFQTLQADIAAYQEHEKRKETLATQLQSTNATLSEKNKEINTLSDEMRKLETEIVDMGDIPDDVASQLVELKKLLSENTQEKMRLREDISRREQELKQHKRDLSLAKDAAQHIVAHAAGITALQQSIKDCDASAAQQQHFQNIIAEAKAEESVLNAQMQDASALIDKLAQLTECPLCRQTVGENHKQHAASEQEAQQAALQEKLHICAQRRDAAERKLASMMDAVEKGNQARRRLSQLEMEIEHAQELIDKKGSIEESAQRLEQDIARLSEKLNHISLEHLEQKIASLEKIHAAHVRRTHILEKKDALLQRIDKLTATLGELHSNSETYTAELSTIQEKLSSFGEKKRECKDVEQALETARVAREEATMQLGQLHAQIDAAHELISSLEQDIRTKEQAQQERDSIVHLRHWLSGPFSELMATMEKQIMLTVHDQFNSKFKEWFEMLMEDELLSTSLDEEFVPRIIQNGYESDVAQLSGGEKTAVALSYRLALNAVVNANSSMMTKHLIILDEPTDGFSAEQLERLSEVVKHLDTQQTIIVSHEQRIESMCTHAIRIKKSEHISRVV